MREEYLNIGEIPAVLYGEATNRLYLFVHGKQGCKEEGKAFAEIVCSKGWQVLGIDLPEHGVRQNSVPSFYPWHVVPELRSVLEYARQHWNAISLLANSVGAWFSMLAFAGEPLEKALFVSPILDMEKLICDMMGWAGVDEARLEREGKIQTGFGETLSWDYFQYAKANPIVKWDTPTAIMYAGQDNLTRRSAVDAFVNRFGCDLAVMEDGEHWFHTQSQLAVLRAWEEKHT